VRTGFARVMHRAAWPDRLAILMYHAIVAEPLPVEDWCFLDAASFRHQLDYLARHFDVLPLCTAVDRLRDGAIRRPTAVITFDDGYQNNHDVAFPLLRERGLPATIFLTTGLVGTDDTVWYCRLNQALAATRQSTLEWRGERFGLCDPSARAEASRALQARLKEHPQARLLAELREIVRALGEDPARPVLEDTPHRMLSHDAIARMQLSGLVEFGAHTSSHAILAPLTPQEREREIDASVAAVEALTGRPCRSFSYPNGRAQDYDEPAMDALRRCQVRAAVTTEAGPNDARTPPLELRRYGVGPDLGPSAFACTVHHWRARVTGRRPPRRTSRR
jgi:peptidoglycan/xylan/chitin deacetylase (PgdA/CDA1 family)